MNGAQAAIRAGYKPRNARVQALRLLTKSNVAAALEAGYKERSLRTQISADDVLREVAAMLFEPRPNVKDIFDGDNLKPMSSLTREQAASIASFEVVKKNLAAGGAKTDIIHRVRVWDVRRSKGRM